MHSRVFPGGAQITTVVTQSQKIEITQVLKLDYFQSLNVVLSPHRSSRSLGGVRTSGILFAVQVTLIWIIIVKFRAMEKILGDAK